MYEQIRHLPSEIVNSVVCERTSHLDQFPMVALHAVERHTPVRRALERSLRKARLLPAATLRFAVAKAAGATVVHSHFGHEGWVDMPFVRAARCHHVVTFYGDDVHSLPLRKPWWRRRYRQLFAHVDLVLCEGPYMAEDVARLGCPREKIAVHHLGIDTERLAFAPLPWRPGETLRVLLAATFREKKGLSYALHAIERVAKHVSVAVTLIGQADDSPGAEAEARRIDAACDRLAGTAQVTRMGYQPYTRLHEIARAHHVFMQPSVTSAHGDTEGGAPIAILEMAALGLMVVATRHCDIPEEISLEGARLLGRERSVDDLEAALDWLVTKPLAWDDVRLANRRHVEREFDARRQGERLGRLYMALAGHPAPTHLGA